MGMSMSGAVRHIKFVESEEEKEEEEKTNQF